MITQYNISILADDLYAHLQKVNKGHLGMTVNEENLSIEVSFYSRSTAVKGMGQMMQILKHEVLFMHNVHLTYEEGFDNTGQSIYHSIILINKILTK